MNLDWEFNLEDIKECKDLYKELKRLDIMTQEKNERQARSGEKWI
jgi:hypothetical protein